MLSHLLKGTFLLLPFFFFNLLKVNYYFTCDDKVYCGKCNIYTYLKRDNNFRTSQQGNVDYILGMEGAFYLVYSFILMT